MTWRILLAFLLLYSSSALASSGGMFGSPKAYSGGSSPETLLKIVGTETNGNPPAIGTGTMTLTSIQYIDNHLGTPTSAFHQNTGTDLIRIASPDNIQASEGSISMWVDTNTTTNWKPYFTYDGGNDGISDDVFRINRGDSTLLTDFYVNGTRYNFNHSSYFDGGFHHLAWTWDATEIKMYIDNVLVDTETHGGLPTLSTSTLTFLNNAAVDAALQTEGVDTIYITNSTTFEGWGE